SKQSNNYLNELIKKSGNIDFSMPYMLGYSGLDDTPLKKYISDSKSVWEENEENIPVSIIGSTIGTHAGPGAIVTAFFKKGI
ncbi:MAG: DegV family protein, partial [Bacillota bacterium]|nr:DegV family protein [Bacillota bacterium]